MKNLAGNLEPHALSEVLTGAMFDILMGVFAKHQKNEVKRCEGRRQQEAERHAARWPTPFRACRCSPSSRSICCRPAR